MTTLLRSVAKVDRRTLVGLIWLLAFSLYFYAFDLPNNAPATRWQMWQVVPFQLLDVVWPLPEANAPPSGWQYLPQRLPAIGTALAVVAAAFGYGLIALRTLRVTKELTRLEQLYFAGGIGLSLWSLLTLGLGLMGQLHPAMFWTMIAAGVICLAVQARSVSDGTRSEDTVADTSGSDSRWKWLAIAVCVVMVWAMLLGALTPQSDFDVLAYHLNGPKEWFQSGRIKFLPHNVYTSFPFLTEMVLLSGMVLLDDWSYGALAGQAALMFFTPLTALGLYCAARRWFSDAAGWLAALVWLTTPWTYRISIIAYAEGGLSFYVLASFLAAVHAVRSESLRASWFVLTGFFAGSAMACKYTGLTSVVVPIALGLSVVLIRRGFAELQGRESFDRSPPHPNLLPRSRGEGTGIRLGTMATLLFAYGLGVVVAIGPWLAKNLWETGNPVYPLAYAVFDGRDLDPELNAKWVKGHATKSYATLGDGVRDFLLRFQDVLADNDWHSPLLYGLAPLSLLWLWRCRAANEEDWSQKGAKIAKKERNLPLSFCDFCASLWPFLFGAWLYLAWLFLTWFFLTHHIDRFWIPMIPLVSLLAGLGATVFTSPIARWIAGLVIAAGVAFNLTICSLIGGYNAGLTELSRAQAIAEASLTPEIRWLNDEYAAGRLTPDFKLLCEGEAATFHARFPVAYHSVFDRSLLEDWCAAGPGPEFPLKSAEEIRETLQRHGITHVFVNWWWIQTYREPGNYGFTDFVTPDRLRELQQLGVLGPPLRLPEPIRGQIFPVNAR